MADIEKLFENNRKWAEDQRRKGPDETRELRSAGRHGPGTAQVANGHCDVNAAGPAVRGRAARRFPWT